MTIGVTRQSAPCSDACYYWDNSKPSRVTPLLQGAQADVAVVNPGVRTTLAGVPWRSARGGTRHEPARARRSLAFRLRVQGQHPPGFSHTAVGREQPEVATGTRTSGSWTAGRATMGAGSAECSSKFIYSELTPNSREALPRFVAGLLVHSRRAVCLYGVNLPPYSMTGTGA